MALPSNWITVTVSATYVMPPTGLPATGGVQFRAVRAVGTDQTIVLPGPISATLNGSGQIEVNLPCPADAGSGATSLVYEVTERIAHGRKRYLVQVDSSMTGAMALEHLPRVDAEPPTDYHATLEGIAAAAAGSAALAQASITNGDVYPSIAAGLAETQGSGNANRYFSVPGADADDYLILYQNNAGSAVEVKRYPSAEAVQELDARIPMLPSTDALDISADSAGGVYRWTDTGGGLHLTGLDGTVQEEIAGIKVTVGGAIPRTFDTYPVPTFPQMIGIEGYGQSNATGANGTPAITLSKPVDIPAWTFNGGVKAMPTNPTVTMTSLRALYEDDLSGDSDINAGSVRGETPFSQMAYSVWTEIQKARGPESVEVFAHTAAVGGKSLGPLSTTYYSRLTDSVAAAKDLSVAAAKTFALAAVVYDGNEANQGSAFVDAATYAASLRSFRDTVVADTKAITGQSWDPIWIMPQKSRSMNSGTNMANVTLAAIIAQGDGMFVSHPDYCTFIVPTADTIHRRNVGHALSGLYHARCFRNVLVRGEDWRGLQLRWCWWKDGKGYAKFDVPVQPLVLDSDELGACTQHGFKLIDATGDLPVTVRVVDGETLEFTPSRARDGAVTLRVGMDYLPAKCTLVAGSGGTTLRDSDTETVTLDGEEYLLANWCLSSTQQFSILE